MKGASSPVYGAYVFLVCWLSWLMPDAFSVLLLSAFAAAILYFLLERKGRSEPEEHIDPAPATERVRQDRHDIRNALSPILLIADRMMMSPDPVQKKTGDTLSHAVGRVMAILEPPSQTIARHKFKQ
jgi:hypothetical protein